MTANRGDIILLLYCWLSSYTLASLGYYLIEIWIPNDYVFGALPLSARLKYNYHFEHPYQYIIIPCFFYGLTATYFRNHLRKADSLNQIFWILLVIVISVLISSSCGGALWIIHDMLAGFVPDSILRMQLNIIIGMILGITFGWQIIVHSFPYNLLGIIVSYFVTKFGIMIFGFFFEESA